MIKCTNSPEETQLNKWFSAPFVTISDCKNATPQARPFVVYAVFETPQGYQWAELRLTPDVSDNAFKEHAEYIRERLGYTMIAHTHPVFMWWVDASGEASDG